MTFVRREKLRALLRPKVSQHRRESLRLAERCAHESVSPNFKPEFPFWMLNQRRTNTR